MQANALAVVLTGSVSYFPLAIDSVSPSPSTPATRFHGPMFMDRGSFIVIFIVTVIIVVVIVKIVITHYYYIVVNLFAGDQVFIGTRGR
jgi:hypothetical protein